MTSDTEVNCDAPGRLNCHRTLGKLLTVSLTVADSSIQTYLLMHLMEQKPWKEDLKPVYIQMSLLD